MSARGCVDDDGSVLSGALDLSDAMSESLEPPPDPRGTEVHVQALALDFSHGELSRGMLHVHGKPVSPIRKPVAIIAPPPNVIVNVSAECAAGLLFENEGLSRLFSSVSGSGRAIVHRRAREPPEY